MNTRCVVRPIVAVVALLVLPVVASSQVHDASVANHRPHLFAAAAFGIDPRTVTLSKDIAPILYENCVACHRPNHLAPMSLITYADARPWARAVKTKVLAREMPPWGADSSVRAYKNDASLTQTEIDTIAAQRLSCCPTPSKTIRTARSRTSGENLFVVFVMMLHPTHKLEPPANPARFTFTVTRFIVEVDAYIR